VRAEREKRGREEREEEKEEEEEARASSSFPSVAPISEARVSHTVCSNVIDRHTAHGDWVISPTRADDVTQSHQMPWCDRYLRGVTSPLGHMVRILHK
jgi:hypothetical protein